MHEKRLEDSLKQRIILSAQENKSEVFDLSILNSLGTNNINCGDLGKVLDNLQNIIYSLALGKDRQQLKISEELKIKSGLFYFETVEEPFSIRFKSNIDPIEKDKSKMYCNDFIELLQHTKNPDEIINAIQKYNKPTKIKFERFIKLLIINSFVIKVKWANPQAKYNEFSTNLQDLKNALKKLEGYDIREPSINHYKGDIQAIDVQSNNFKLLLDENIVIQGKISSGMNFNEFKIRSMVNAEIKSQEVINRSTKVSKTKYTLLDIEIIN